MIIHEHRLCWVGVPDHTSSVGLRLSGTLTGGVENFCIDRSPKSTFFDCCSEKFIKSRRPTTSPQLRDMSRCCTACCICDTTSCPVCRQEIEVVEFGLQTLQR